MFLQPRAQVLTNHSHTEPISQLLNHKQITHHTSSIHGCVVVEKKASKLGFQEPFDECFRLKRIIITAGSIRIVYFQTRLRTAEELLVIVFFKMSRYW
jgi:hypothetical protein